MRCACVVGIEKVVVDSAPTLHPALAEVCGYAEPDDRHALALRAEDVLA
jgi:hypothetical protein